MNITIVGAGRAGRSFGAALAGVGHRVDLRHHDDLSVAPDVALVLLCVPDDAIRATADALAVPAGAVVAHCAGSRTLDELGPVARPASLHPLVTLPDAVTGSQRLRGAVYCTAGDPLVGEVVASLGGRAITIPDADRARYHAAACVAANHLVVLMGQVKRIAESAGLELGDFLTLARGALEDVAHRGPAGALTGPAARGDLATIDRHLAAIEPAERPLYGALAAAALTLAERGRVGAPL